MAFVLLNADRNKKDFLCYRVSKILSLWILIYKAIQGLPYLPEYMDFLLEDGQDFPRHVRKIFNTSLSLCFIVLGTKLGLL